MRKSYIVLCILCAVLIGAGTVLCLIGRASGDVFDNSNTHSDTPVISNISGSLSSLVIKCDKADVTVHGGAESDYIETVNIDADMINVKNSEVSIKNADYFTAAYNTVMNFNGLRNILFPGKSYSGDKKIDVYLSEKSSVKQINIEIENGTVQIFDMKSSTDYGLRINGKGEISAENVSTPSRMDINVNDGNVTLRSTTCLQLEGGIQTGNLHVYADAKKQNCSLKCSDGQIYILDESQGAEYEKNVGETSKFTFSVGSGNIYIHGEEKSE